VVNSYPTAECDHQIQQPIFYFNFPSNDGDRINPLNAELNPICHLLALLGGATIVVVSRLRVKLFKEWQPNKHIHIMAIG
jgi:hypothetical protein